MIGNVRQISVFDASERVRFTFRQDSLLRQLILEYEDPEVNATAALSRQDVEKLARWLWTSALEIEVLEAKQAALKGMQDAKDTDNQA